MLNEDTEIVLVTLEYQNGQSTKIVEIIKGGMITKPLEPKRSGYKFLGWFNGEELFDFSSHIDENITLLARWEKEQESSVSNDQEEIIINDEQSEDKDVSKYDAFIEKYKGCWYLSGYADVFIDVSKEDYVGDDDAMSIRSTNFSFPFHGTSDHMIIEGYTIYPFRDKDCSMGAVSNSSFSIVYNRWEEDLANNKVVLGSNCIYINNHKFVRNKGTKDRYSDTCYREALGTWYLYNQPDSILEITVIEKGNIDNSDTFKIKATNFELDTFETNMSYDGYYGRADRNSEWKKYGIMATKDKLTVSNSKGTRTFYRSKTYSKVTGISLSESEIKLSPSSSKKLSAKITPSDAYNKEITWSSNNPSVATVDASGQVKAHNEGHAVISVQTKDGNYTATCNVVVERIKVSGVSLSHQSLNMIKGNSKQLNVSVSPENAQNKEVTWSSSDPSVVSVSASGKITALKRGKAIISVKTIDGGFSASCEVVVRNPELSLDVSLAIQIISGGNTSMIVEAKPSGGSENYVEYNIELYYEGNLIAQSNEKTLNVGPVKKGTYKAVVYVRDSEGNETTVTETSTISYW